MSVEQVLNSSELADAAPAIRHVKGILAGIELDKVGLSPEQASGVVDSIRNGSGVELMNVVTLVLSLIPESRRSSGGRLDPNWGKRYEV